MTLSNARYSQTPTAGDSQNSPANLPPVDEATTKTTLTTDMDALIEQADIPASAQFGSTATPLHPVKKHTATAWVLTLVLHLLIASALVGYWYFYQRPTTQKTLPLEVQAKAEVPTHTQAQPTPSSAALSTLSRPASGTQPMASQPVPATANDTNPNTTAQRPLANYVATQMAAQQATHAASTPITLQTVTHPAPVTKALTSRDIPAKAMTQPPQATNPTPQAKTSAIAEATTNPPEKEASKLSNDIDIDNAELAKLIDQVKTQNQQKIDAETPTTSGKNSPINTPTYANEDAQVSEKPVVPAVKDKQGITEPKTATTKNPTAKASVTKPPATKATIDTPSNANIDNNRPNNADTTQ